MIEAKLDLTLMRHARSRADDEQVHEGRYDAPLTEAGRAQVRRRAEDFKQRGWGFARIVASPLQRAHETAVIIGQSLGTPVETDPDWMELDNGLLQGLSYTEAAERFPRPAFRNPYQPIAVTGESEWALYLRAAGAVERVVRSGAGSTLVVAHGAILNAALRAIAGLTPYGNLQGIWFGFEDTGFARLSYDPGRHIWRLSEFDPGFVTP